MALYVICAIPTILTLINSLVMTYRYAMGLRMGVTPIEIIADEYFSNEENSDAIIITILLLIPMANVIPFISFLVVGIPVFLRRAREYNLRKRRKKTC